MEFMMLTGRPSDIRAETELALSQISEEKAVITVTAGEVDHTKQDTIPNSKELPLRQSTIPEGLVPQIAEKVLAVIQSYGQHTSTATENGVAQTWLGKTTFIDKVEAQIRANQPIRMILPAFPWKSINRVDKVIGVLPDLGEVLALSRLDQLCRDVQSVYTLGGEIHLATDGLLFDDIVGISDSDTWAYSECLMGIVAEKKFTGIKLLRVMDILGLVKNGEMSENLYYSLTKTCRERLLAEYGQSEEDVRRKMKEDEDTLRTYCGFDLFLKTDLKYSPVTSAAKNVSKRQYGKLVKKIAIQMMIRAESFTELLRAKCPNHVRLSVHPSSGAVKLSVPLIRQRDGAFARTPWHSVCALSVSGDYYMGHAKDLKDTHNLVHHNGRPYYYREKSELWDWECDDVAFEPRYPNELHIYPLHGDGDRTLSETEMGKIRGLSKVFEGVLEVRGFGNVAQVFDGMLG